MSRVDSTGNQRMKILSDNFLQVPGDCSVNALLCVSQLGA